MSAAEKRAATLRKAKMYGRVLFIVFGILAVIGNVQAAGDSVTSKVWHALPPLAFMGTVEFAILFLPEFSEKVARIGYAATGFIAAASFALSYMSLRHVASDAGMGWGEWLFPILFEVTALTFSGIALAASRALADAEHEAERAEKEEAAAQRAAAEADAVAKRRAVWDAEEAERVAAQAKAVLDAREASKKPSVAEEDARTLAAEFPRGLPKQAEAREVLGWGAGKAQRAYDAYRTLGLAPIEPVTVPEQAE